MEEQVDGIYQEKPASAQVNGTTPGTAPSASGLPCKGEALATSPNQETTTLEQTLASLHISSDIPGTIFRDLASIFQASQLHGPDIALTQPNGDDIYTILSCANTAVEDEKHDAAALIAVRAVLDQMFFARSQLLLPALKIIADASRDPSWRLAMGKSGLLDFALTIITAENSASDLQVQAFRLIGNSCADTDENRERVVSNNYLQIILVKIEHSIFTSIALTVFYNICQDYEPAQKKAVESGLYGTLIRVLEAKTLVSLPTLTYLCQLLDTGLETFNPLISPENAAEVLLDAATQPDLDSSDCVSLLDCAVAHLQSEPFQRHMVTHDLFGVALRFLIRSYFPQANITSLRLPSSEHVGATTRDPSEEAELSRARKSLVQSLSDASALPEFTAKHSSLSTPLVSTLASYLTSSHPLLQEVSCIILGNLARSDAICTGMMSELQIHKPLIAILQSSSATSTVFSALSFLRNLALPVANKASLGSADIVPALSRYLTTSSASSPLFSPQLSYTAAALLRQLVNLCLPNIHRLLAPLSTESDSPASSKTHLSLLLALYSSSDEPPLKTEVARTVAAILRCIHSSPDLGPDERDVLALNIYKLHPGLAAPLGAMVSQTQYPTVHSEGWFAMALMARSAEGACLVETVTSEPSVFSVLEDTVRGSGSGSGSTESASGTEVALTNATPPFGADQAPSQAQGEMRTKDRTNALILVDELVRNVEGMGEARKSALEQLLRDGASLVTP